MSGGIKSIESYLVKVLKSKYPSRRSSPFRLIYMRIKVLCYSVYLAGCHCRLRDRLTGQS